MRKPFTPDDPRHGTNNGYQNLRCRCAPCTEAHRLYFYDGPGRMHLVGYRHRRLAKGWTLSGSPGKVRKLAYRRRPNAGQSSLE